MKTACTQEKLPSAAVQEEQSGPAACPLHLSREICKEKILLKREQGETISLSRGEQILSTAFHEKCRMGKTNQLCGEGGHGSRLVASRVRTSTYTRFFDATAAIMLAISLHLCPLLGRPCRVLTAAVHFDTEVPCGDFKWQSASPLRYGGAE